MRKFVQPVLIPRLLDALRALPEDCAVALLVGHAPGVPGVAYELADPDASDSSALAALERRSPAAAIVRLEFAGPWAELAEAVLVSARFADGSELSPGVQSRIGNDPGEALELLFSRKQVCAGWDR